MSFPENILYPIASLLGKFLSLIYNSVAFQSYGLAIIIFTIIIRLIFLPLTIKQYHSTTAMQQLQPQIQEIQKRYKNDKEKLNTELMNFYKENKVNPAGGCLPLLIQMPILFSLIYVIGKPLTYMLQMTSDQITKLINDYIAQVPDKAQRITGYYEQIGVVNHFHTLNLDFLGLNLGLVPSWHTTQLFGAQSLQYLALLIIPILSVTTTYISIKLSTPKTQPSSSNDQSMQNSMQRSMTLMMPAMTLLFSFQFPAGLGLYWIIGNVIQTFQQLYINKFILKKKEVVSK